MGKQCPSPRGGIATSPFDRWFKDQVRNLTGIDPDVQPLGPPSEVIFDTRDEAPVV